MIMHILFQLTENRRKCFIVEHEFYTEQANKRLLSQFQNMEAEADAYGQKWLNDVSPHFDPDRHDPGAFYEQAYDEICGFYQQLEAMQNRTRLGVVAAIFHEWDKQLRSWLIGEIHHWHRGEEIEKVVWRGDFNKIVDLLESFGYSIKTHGYYVSLNRCRLVVNAYKHGHGKSFDDIKSQYPEFVETFGATEPDFLKYADHNALKIEEKHIEEFSNAIIKFWNNVPEDVFKDRIEHFPSWFQNSYKKDLDNS